MDGRDGQGRARALVNLSETLRGAASDFNILVLRSFLQRLARRHPELHEVARRLLAEVERIVAQLADEDRDAILIRRLVSSLLKEIEQGGAVDADLVRPQQLLIGGEAAGFRRG